MNSKLVSLVIALVLGVLAAITSGVYLTGARKQIDAEAQPVEVLVAQEDIPRGLSAEEMLARRMIAKEQVPQRYVAAGAISSVRSVEEQVLSVPVAKGGQLTRNWFQYPSDAGLAYSIPKDLMAITIPADEVKGVAGLIKPGDHVMVLATFTPGPRGKDVTSILLRKAPVIAVDKNVGAEAEASQDKNEGIGVGSDSSSQSGQSRSLKSVTLALNAQQIQKLVFAEEKGKVWLALIPASQMHVQDGQSKSLQTVSK